VSGPKYIVSYPARLQVERLSEPERSALSSLFATIEPERTPHTHRISNGSYVSRLKNTRRVLWRQTKEGPEILSVVDSSYAA